MSNEKSVAARLFRDWRTGKGLSQNEAAALIGSIDFTQVSKYERGVAKPGLKNALRIEEISAGAVPASAWNEEPSADASMPPTEAAS